MNACIFCKDEINTNCKLCSYCSESSLLRRGHLTSLLKEYEDSFQLPFQRTDDVFFPDEECISYECKCCGGETHILPSISFCAGADDEVEDEDIIATRNSPPPLTSIDLDGSIKYVSEKTNTNDYIKDLPVVRDPDFLWQH